MVKMTPYDTMSLISLHLKLHQRNQNIEELNIGKECEIDESQLLYLVKRKKRGFWNMQMTDRQVSFLGIFSDIRDRSHRQCALLPQVIRHMLNTPWIRTSQGVRLILCKILILPNRKRSINQFLLLITKTKS